MPLPASTTWRKRKVSSSCGVRVFGPHPMHCDVPGASPCAFRCATKGASGGHTAVQVSIRFDSDADSELQFHSSLPWLESGEGGTSSWTDGWARPAHGAMPLQWEPREKSITAVRAPDMPGWHWTGSDGEHDTALARGRPACGRTSRLQGRDWTLSSGVLDFVVWTYRLNLHSRP